MDDWRIAQELAARFDAEFGFETVEDVQDEIARVAPVVRGCRRRAHAPRARRRGAPDRRLPRRDRVPGRARAHHRPLVGADQARRRGRRVAPVLARHGRGGGERHRLRPDQARTRQRRGAGGGRSGRRGGGRGRRRGARGAPRAPRVGPVEHAAGADAARRVQSPPRGRPHALRRRTLVSSTPSLAALATGTALVVHPSDLEPHRRERRGRRRARHHAARHGHARRCSPTPPPRPAPRSWRSRRAATSVPTTSSTSPPTVTELRVETTR